MTDTAKKVKTNDIFDPDGDVVLILSQSEGRPPTELRVSSRHLSLASPVFKAMFTGKFTESETLRNSGSVTINLADDDEQSMSILLSIIHGRFYCVPKVVDLKTLKHIAILVDKYSMHETVSHYLDGWVNGAESSTISVGDFKTWLCIARVFDLPDKFQVMSRSWILESPLPFDATGLPIPAKFVGKLNTRRERMITKIISELISLTKEYLNDNKFRCNQNPNGKGDAAWSNLRRNAGCDAMVLGYLTKMLMKLGIMTLNDQTATTKHNNNFNGLSVYDLISQIKAYRIQSLHSLEADFPNRNLPACAVEGWLHSRIDSIVSNEQGLSLNPAEKATA